MITYEFNDNKLTIKISGRVDSANANQVDQEVFQILNEHDTEYVTLDIEELVYISSAGLRVLLKLRKAKELLKIINASSDVYEIFEMTGFSEMMDISKAYRRLSIDGCEVVGEGANGKVYRLDADTIIKVYNNKDALPDIQRERELARKAFVLGIPTAIPYDVVKVNDTYGSVFELLNAYSFAKLIIREPENIDKYIDLNCDLLKKIHSTEVKNGDMPHMKEVAVNWVTFLKDYLPVDKYEKLLRMVNEVPDTNYMMHGDYHIKNVMMQNGEVLLIDMDTLCLGHPIFEFASIFNAYIGFNAVNNEEKTFLGITREQSKYFFYETVKKYLGTEDENKINEFVNKAALIGYVRLCRRLIRRHGLETEDGRRQVNFFKTQILELIDKVDTLL